MSPLPDLILEEIFAQLLPYQSTYLRSCLDMKAPARRAREDERDRSIRCYADQWHKQQPKRAEKLETKLIFEKSEMNRGRAPVGPQSQDARAILSLNNGKILGVRQIRNILAGARTPVTGK
jgi:hypothetical protein